MTSGMQSATRLRLSAPRLLRAPGPSAPTVVAIWCYLAFSAFVGVLGMQQGRWYGVIAVALTPLAFQWRDRPMRLALLLIAGGIILRLTFYGLLDADGLAISQGALHAVSR